MALGYLKIQARSAQGLLPEEGARVQILSSAGELISEFITNASGDTEVITLDAPEALSSLSPDGIPETDYSTYNVRVNKAGFTPVVVDNVQIFDGQTSILPVNLIPLGYSIQPIIFDLPSHNIREDNEPGNLRPVSSPSQRILNDVVIPNTITVHMGPPNSQAKNVTLNFIDYIKNVASSEIYPTWPESALEANIYAIISFALNRIFTEWYPSKGYAFDITASTAYDQKFIEGREIFDSISKIADRIFNQYIKRKELREPLFAVYCDGDKAMCDGLSQWGTAALAGQGYDTMDILNYYYGPDIEIGSSDLFQANYSSFPGSSLKLGDTGQDVQKMQIYLNAISNNFPLIPKISNPNGSFGEDTEETVKVFQEVFGLTPDGIIGIATWFKISSVYTAVRNLSELSSKGDLTIGAVPPNTVIRQGSTGMQVTNLQNMINFISYFIPEITPVEAVDGRFGVATRNSVVSFQKYFDLPQDGIVGPATWNKLYEVYWNINETSNIPSPGSEIPLYPGYLISMGARGEDVAAIQNCLNNIAAVYPDIPSVAVDGIFGSETQNAVMAFQTFCNIRVDGIVGRETWNQLMELCASVSGGKVPDPIPELMPYPGFLITYGSAGNYVMAIQSALNKIAQEYPSIPAISVDGIFGRQTENAVIIFERQFGLTPDGVVGPQTWDALMELSAGMNYEAQSVEVQQDLELPPYPGYFISFGSYGENVAQVQRCLNEIGFSYPSINQSLVDGYFGEYTLKNVTEFQRLFGLRPDGIVGPDTWDMIMEVCYSTTVQSDAQSMDNITKDNNVASESFNEDDNAEIIEEPDRTNNNDNNGRDMNNDNNNSNNNNGDNNRNVNEDMDREDNYRNYWEGDEIPEYPGYLISVGSVGDYVKLIQQVLNRVSQIYRTIPGVTEDGVFGRQTERSVIAFQRQFGLLQDGIVGHETWDKMMEVYLNIEDSHVTNNKMSSQNSPADPEEKQNIKERQDVSDKDIKINTQAIFAQGSRGKEITLIQNYLNAFATKYKIAPAINITGIYDQDTKGLVEIFQRFESIEADGIVNNITWDALQQEYDGIAKRPTPINTAGSAFLKKRYTK